MRFIIPFSNFSLFESDEENQEFSFDELSPEIQEKVLSNYKEEYRDKIDSWWYEDVIENFKSGLEELGLENIECNFSGFWSQGDGASFTARVRDVGKFFKEALKLQPVKWFAYGEEKEEKEEEDEIDAMISGFEELGINSKIIPLTPDDFWINIERNSSRYYHEFTISAEIDVEEPMEGRNFNASEQKEFDNWLGSLADSITKWARQKSRELYSELEAEYGSINSDKAVIEWMDSMDYKFTREGEKIG
jgi:hypothetical protein